MSPNKPTPSFNTVKKSNRQARRQRKKYSRVLLLAIFAVTALLLLTSLIFGVCLMVDGLIGDTETPVPPPTNNNANSSIQYDRVTQLASGIRQGILLNVNDQHAFDFENEIDMKNIAENRANYQEEFNTYSVIDLSWMLESETLDAFNRMMLKYYEVFGEEEHIWVVSAYRSYEDQLQGSYDSLPGFSDHHTGLCVAIKTGDRSGANRRELDAEHWIYQNCHKYGFVVRYPDHKSEITGISGYDYCLRYVGVAHATYMTQYDLCLEEYTKHVSEVATKDNPIKFQAVDGNQYSVYYVKAEDDLITLEVPKNYNYTISGDKIGGCIITVNFNQPKN